MCRVYTLTVMVTLLARPQLRDTLGSGNIYNSFATNVRENESQAAIRVGVTKTVENDQDGSLGHGNKNDIELGSRGKIQSQWNDRKVAAI